ncbi:MULTISPECIES: tyrosine-type recombinase/integrase [Paraburkholderia]|uniref:tyrosine-type recombinase/integrase n=1 Tax=Paraburkholderia TaxID=1822464 RepID=UPI002256D07B|nr:MULTISPECIES: tyrosine-type recombinase/integrase [Paraburkholderia]MCX4163676.1 tyrosine-type recombinase/integrase [Paraburkholderia megapolitana]MDN7159171.1 tyrosine-type recombinase/integrase [Paraburkholderia sp. CHISQ3]MDQ6496218.1 tyrosine-type recombinase/integrase [Paraburkholderia megapolitana]
MLQDLFPKVHRRYEESRFAADLEDFAVWLRRRGYSRTSACDHLFRAKQTLERMDIAEPGGTFSAEHLYAAFTSLRFPALYRGTQRAFECFLSSRNRLILAETDDPFDALRDHYLQHLRELRGFAVSTVAQHDSTIREFLSRIALPEQTLRTLSATDVEEYIRFKSQEVTRQTLQHVIAHLRAFLRYCEDRGDIVHGLHHIDTPRTYRGELPPRALDWKLVPKLVNSVDRRSRAGWRDHAVLHLMAYYGLRASEVAALTLSSINWESRTLHVQQCKTHSILILPLADRTINLLRRYLRYGRSVNDCPALFLRARSPAGSLTHYGVVDIFYKRTSDLH